MIGSDKLGFSFVRVTAIHASQHRLWIGSGNGIIISVPLVNQNQNSMKELPSYDSVHLVNSNTLEDQEEEIITPSIENAQLALHGFKDAVRFFCESNGLVIAGGVGSIDFRSEMIGQNVPGGNSGEKSHLLAWQEK
jgi:mitogen-activated protein kinase 8 interacting protein 3